MEWKVAEILRLREENARLTQQVNLLTVRRDQLMAEVKRLEGLILLGVAAPSQLRSEAHRIVREGRETEGGRDAKA